MSFIWIPFKKTGLGKTFFKDCIQDVVLIGHSLKRRRGVATLIEHPLLPNMYIFVVLLFMGMYFLSQTLKVTYIIRVHSRENLDSECVSAAATGCSRDGRCNLLQAHWFSVLGCLVFLMTAISLFPKYLYSFDYGIIQFVARNWAI